MEIINSLGKILNLKLFSYKATLFTKKQLSENEKKIPHLNDLNYINFEKKVYKMQMIFLVKKIIILIFLIFLIMIILQFILMITICLQKETK